MLSLNPIQYKFWADDLLKYPALEYNDTNMTLVIKGELSLSILHAAYLQIMKEYPPFHSTIQIVDGQPYFQVKEYFEVPLSIKEESSQNKEEIRMLIKQLVYQTFDLKKELPCRFYAIHVKDEWYLCHLFHHIVMDGKSFADFFKRLSAIYNELKETGYSRTISQNDWIQSYNRSFQHQYNKYNLQDVHYWTDYLDDIPLEVQLPKLPITHDMHEEEAFRFVLGSDLLQQCDLFCEQQHTSHFRLFSIAWAITISKIFQTDRLLMDHTLHMRTPLFDSLFGVFINNLPLKFEFDENKSIYDLIKYAKENRANEKLHLNCFYGDILTGWKGKRQESKANKLLNIGINYPVQTENKGLLNLNGCTTYESWHINVPIAEDLMLQIEDDADFTCDLRYSKNVPLELVRTLSETFQVILRQVILHPALTVKDINIVSPEKQQALLEIEEYRLYDVQIDNTTFLDDFKTVISIYPQNTAVVCESDSLTYAELDRQSDILAKVLVAQGKKGRAIGVCIPKSPNMIIGIMGILKSGNTYVPLDESYPHKRIDFILSDCGIEHVLVTQETHVYFPVKGLMIDDLLLQATGDITLPIVLPNDIAYIIYTSGTTGLPKGTPIHHQALSITAHTNAELFPVNEKSRVLQYANICFDISVEEIFSTLLMGATMILPSPQVRKDPQLLMDFLEEKQITCASIPPAILPLLPFRHLPHLATISVGGEITQASAIKSWSRNHRFLNLYGPTEVCVYSNYCLMSPESDSTDIGISFPGVTSYILNKNFQLVPDYAMGELYLGGYKLTPGYLNRPDINKEKFVENPFVSDKDKALGINTRLYKTGDLVMRRSDGHILFIGRSDFQVKLHGFRIELGDIESKIVEYGNNITHAVVLVHERNQVKQLLAYLQTNSSEFIDTKPLKTFLQEQLPSYMVPTLFIQLEKLPLNASGKLDRNALPSPELFKQEEVGFNDKKELPQTTTEKKLASLWSKLLSTAVIGRNDNFIALGGDSMSIILLTFAIEETFGISIQASEIYKHLSLAEMATFIEHKSSQISTMAEDQSSATDQIPLAPSQMDLWMQCAVSSEMKDAYNVPVLFECPVDCSDKLLEEGLNRCIELQDSFRISFPLNNGVPFIRIHPVAPADMHIEVVDKDKDLIDCYKRGMLTSFDLENGPLFRAALYKSKEGKKIFLLVMHHLISDGWSANLLQDILFNVAKGIAVRPEMLTGSYQEYALSAHSFTTSDSFAQRKDYWNAYFSKVEPLHLFAPLQNKKQSVKGFTEKREISLEHSNKIQNWCRSHSTTPFSFYYATFLLLLAKLSGQSNFLVGFPFSGRESSKYRKTIGYFVNMLPICYESRFQELPFSAYLSEIKNKIIKAESYALSAHYLLEAAGRPLSDDYDWPLVKAVFAYEEDSLFMHYQNGREISTFPLTLSVVEKENGNSCYIESQEKYVDREFAHQILSAYLNLLEAVLEDTEKKANTYRLSSLEYQQQIIQENSLSQQSIRILPTTFLDEFYRQVELIPENVALSFHSKQLTYHELDMKSSSLARYLQDYPTGAIGVCMRPSLEIYIVILGILKANRIFVPIDRDMPDSRKDFIFKDASCQLLFADEKMDWTQNKEVCILPGIKAILARCADSTDRSVISPDSYAYYIYTSGTTGTPKGIPIKHSALGHLVTVERDKFALRNDSKVLQFASVSFDAAITEIFTSWAAGATLIIADSQQRHDPMLLADLLETEQITCATIPPALLPLLPKRSFPALETIIVGGESTIPSAIYYWSKGRRFINAYGPTENTVDTTLCFVDSSFEPNDIGTPLPGVSSYVLDEAMNIVPEGIIGELYIGGRQLTDGYLNRPELTAQMFVENPFISPSDKVHHLNWKLYKSGDLVKRRSDGHLIFIGRMDNQIKLNGYRIELGEIETRLQECDDVQNAIVLQTKDTGKEELAAYVQLVPGSSMTPFNLRKMLSCKLPAYMIPTKWAIVEDLSLTVNGKIDKQKLPQTGIIVSDNVLIPATTTAEYGLLKIAKELLETEEIGVTTDLIDAGMSSLHIMQFSMAAHQAGFQNISISSVYKDRTIRKILKDQTNKLYFWANGYEQDKPVMVLICGYPYYSPFYDDFVKFFSREYSIFVLESHHEFFLWKENVSLDILMKTFDEILQRELKDKKIAILTGYCMACELCIAFAQYRIKHHPDWDSLRILNMEGVFQRVKEEKEPDSGDELINEHQRITTILSDDLPPLDYSGEIINCMAKNGSARISLEGYIETDSQKLQEIKELQKLNWVAWQQHFPSAPFCLIDCDHWHFFEEKNLILVNKVIHDYWGSKIK